MIVALYTSNVNELVIYKNSTKYRCFMGGGGHRLVS